MLAYDDNRNFYRMLINAQCKITTKDDSFTGVCKDLSASGMSFELENKPLTVGTTVTIEIDSQNREIPSFSADAKVIREPISHDNKYVIGVKFTQMH